MNNDIELIIPWVKYLRLTHLHVKNIVPNCLG